MRVVKRFMLNTDAVVKSFNEVIFNAPQGALIEVTDLNRVIVWIDGKLKLNENRFDPCPNPSFIFFSQKKVIPYCLDNNALDYLEALNLVKRIEDNIN